MKKSEQYFEKNLNFLRKKNLYPVIHEVDGPSSFPEILIKGEKYTNFCSNNYLGLAGNEEIKQVVAENIRKYGVGSGSTRMLSGTLDVQVEFEKKLAKFLGKENSITFSSGYMANIGVIRMLADAFPYFDLFGGGQGVIISDELNHASIIDGVRLSKAKREIYRHSDMNSLEKILKKYKNKRKLILTDGVFSMDGDMAKLKEICELSKSYDAIVMVDDSHGLGVLGPNGEGVAHKLEIYKDVDIIMGSFTKAFGSIGGFIATDNVISDYLRITARTYIFSDPIIPAVVAGLIKALEIIENGGELRKKAIGNADMLRDGLKGIGFEVLGESTTIVPLLIGTEKKAIKFAEMLYEKNILAPCIRRPAVVEGKERIRFSVMATHEEEQIGELLNECEKIGKFLKII
ncbi:MAG: hypothetical protein A2599_00730 [Candidatus Staskawiczbacteria bacterium RIFOXYD1_FULL_39_28]|uniref:Aminotransferase class I/classII large domain-containing protein n=1 Tax=Candidatus Staskawiczbacteria bacterium RIFOXYC1_FULL_38_18 TaxID=1802229 RepID=A0A1G2JEC8_9BACT|nr:MAG: hypothetical protein A2401_03180 [Candidatus Staskawiczbacteria bacterium RIFOXYC1_FULL_38_18]OGZ90679.1 MAG: hypothetical protein A2599_00730 [Candidatus Staskawiczbacteria bacterium RIFOXYD1_FULL_39_28]